MNVLAISPHPDDETLGCGGSLLYHKNKGDNIYWLNITNITKTKGWSKKFVEKRQEEMIEVEKEYRFNDVYDLELPSTELDIIPIAKLVDNISKIYKIVKPEIIFAPFIHDVHTDHQVVSQALFSTFKWFRYPHIKKVFMYETLSETDFNFTSSFRPNTFIDITKFIDNKIKIMNIYESEIKKFPFPRSEKSIRALASLRGSQCGYDSAEAFQLLYQRI